VGPDPTFREIEHFVWGTPEKRFHPSRDFLGHATAIDSEDGRPGTSLMNVLRQRDARFVGPAAYFLSWTWLYRVSDVVDGLRELCRQQDWDPSTTYVWMCFFVNNQRVWLLEAEPEPMSRPERIQECIDNVGGFIVLLDRHEGSTYFSRIWLIFELFVALQLCPRRVHLALPKQAHLALQDALRTKSRRLAAIDADHAKAANPAEERALKEMLSRTAGGMEAVNRQLGDLCAQLFAQQ